MSERWKTVSATEIRPGDRIRAAGDELVVTRIESTLLGNEGLLAFIEDSPERWYKRPVARDAEVEVLTTD